MRVTIDIDESLVAEALVNACEGGSGYWARTDRYPYEDGPDVPLRLRLPVTVLDWYEDETDKHDRNTYTLDHAALGRGLQLMAEKHPQHFADMLSESGDAITGDVLLQLSTLGELKYG